VLTSREREVAMLVAKGMTNKEIAARLFVSKRTVDAHIEHILAKLSYASRVQIAALATSGQAQEAREAQEERGNGEQGERAREDRADRDEESGYQVPVPRAPQERIAAPPNAPRAEVE
jgi:DNA-binding CsgD family transcriptional regulator